MICFIYIVLKTSLGHSKKLYLMRSNGKLTLVQKMSDSLLFVSLTPHLSISSCSRQDSSMAIRSCSSKLEATPKCPDNLGSVTAL